MHNLSTKVFVVYTVVYTVAYIRALSHTFTHFHHGLCGKGHEGRKQFCNFTMQRVQLLGKTGYVIWTLLACGYRANLYLQWKILVTADLFKYNGFLSSGAKCVVSAISCR